MKPFISMPSFSFCSARLQPTAVCRAVSQVLLLIALPAHAANEQENTTEREAATALSEVVITATHDQSPVQVVTDPKRPRQPIPASDAADYLKTIPGFSAIRSGGSNGDPVFRGQFGSRIPTLINGTTVLGACGSRMDAPSSYISPETYDQLTLVKGPQTVLWGPGASAGVVRFDRLPPTFSKPGVRFSASLMGASAGRNDQSAELEAGNAFMYLRGSAHRSQSGDYRDGNGHKVHSAWNKWNTDFSVGLTPDAHTVVELSAGAGDGSASYAARSMDGAKFQRQSWGLRFEREHISPWLTKLEAQVYSNQIHHVMDNYSLRAFTPAGGIARSMATNVRRHTTGGRLAFTLNPFENVKVITGLDAQRSPLAWRSGTPESPYQDREWMDDAKLSNVGWFGEVHWQATDKSRWVGGLRLDHAKAQRYPASVDDRRSRSALPSAFFRLEQRLENDTTVYAGLGHVQRFPDYWELVAPGNSATEKGNAFMTLRPEKTTQLDFGANWTRQRWSLWASGYVNAVQDFILFDYPGRSSMVRNVDASTAGFELGGRHQISAAWSAQATLAGTWAWNRTDRRPLPQIPPAELRLGLDYAHGGWTAGALWRLTSAQRRIAQNQGNAVGKDFGTSGGFGVVSVHAGYRVNEKFKLLLGIDNLFNKTYAEHLNLAGNAGFGFAGGTRINEPGRTVWLRAVMKF